MDQNAVLAVVVEWAEHDDNVRAVVVTGSVARKDGMRDRLSDLDVELYVREPARLLDADDWYQRFGEVLVVEALANEGWNPTRLIYYVDGKIDFTINAVDVGRSSHAQGRAHRVVLDKDGIAGTLRAPSERLSVPPTPHEFVTCNHWFYAASIMCAKCLARDEPWMAKYRDWDLKQQLLRVIEWDHKGRYGWTYDTWHKGAHIYRWMDDDVVERLRTCWANFSIDDGRRALAASVDLFDMLSRRFAHAVGFEPFDSARVRVEIASILDPSTR